MESSSKMFDSLKLEKENAIARFNRVRRVMKLLQIIEVAVVFVAISWYAPAIASTAGVCLTHLFNHLVQFLLFNHHVQLLIGNALIVLLIMLSCQSDGGAGGGGDLYDDYAWHSEIPRALPPPEQGEAMPAEFGGGDCDKQIVAVVADETTESSQSQCDDVAAVIEKAARKMRKLQRNRSEMALRREVTELRKSETEKYRETVSSERQMRKLQRNRSEMALRCEVTVRPELRKSETEIHREAVCSVRQMRKLQRNQSEMALRREVTVRLELRRSEMENRRETVSSVIENLSSEEFQRRETVSSEIENLSSEVFQRRETVSSEIENLSSEEFKRRVDAFIDTHWIKTTAK